MLYSTSPSLEGYQITEYLGLTTGAETYNIGGLIGEGYLKQNLYFSGSVNRALAQMTEEANKKGANAIVGIQTSSASGTGSVVVTVIGTMVKITPVSEVPEKEIPIVSVPVQHLNTYDPIRPVSVLLRTEAKEIALTVSFKKKDSLKAVRASIVLHTVFGEYIIEDQYFISFTKTESGTFESKFRFYDIPEHLMEVALYSDVMIKGYVIDSELTEIKSGKMISSDEAEEEIRQITAEALGTNKVSIELFEQFQSSKEMLEYVETLEGSIPDDLYQKLTKTLNSRCYLERMYGTNPASTLKTLKREVFDKLE